LPDAVQNYLHEIDRLLAGTCFATFFLLNSESRGLIERGRDHVGFRFDLGQCKVRSKIKPERAIAYDEGQVSDWLKALGFVVQSKRFGNWCGRPGQTFQDIITFSARPGRGARSGR